MRAISRTIFSLLLVLAATLMASSQAAAQDCTGPNGDHGVISYSEDFGVFQGCTPHGWVAMNSAVCPDGDGCNPDACDPANSPTPGTACANGSIYAGLSPDGNVPMFTTPADAPSLMSWNDGTGTWVDTAMQNCVSESPGAEASCRTGRDNTNLLVGLGAAPSPAPYIAANYCNDLDAHGFTDWYLPAQDELNVLYVNLALDGGADVTPGNSFGFNRTGSFPAGWYWSSSENVSTRARGQRFSDGLQLNPTKSSGLAVRCVRR